MKLVKHRRSAAAAAGKAQRNFSNSAVSHGYCWLNSLSSFNERKSVSLSWRCKTPSSFALTIKKNIFSARPKQIQQQQQLCYSNGTKGKNMLLFFLFFFFFTAKFHVFLNNSNAQNQLTSHAMRDQ